MSADDKILTITIFCCAVILLSVFTYVLSSTPNYPPFFQLWLLDPNDEMFEPFLEITSNETYSLSLTVENNRGSSESCNLVIKGKNFFDNTSQELTRIHFDLNKNENWSKTINYRFISNRSESQLIITSLRVNGDAYSVVTPIVNPGPNDVSYQFIFELWHINGITEEYEPSGAWVSSPFLKFVD